MPAQVGHCELNERGYYMANYFEREGGSQEKVNGEGGEGAQTEPTITQETLAGAIKEALFPLPEAGTGGEEGQGSAQEGTQDQQGS